MLLYFDDHIQFVQGFRKQEANIVSNERSNTPAASSPQLDVDPKVCPLSCY